MKVMEETMNGLRIDVNRMGDEEVLTGWSVTKSPKISNGTSIEGDL